jgi:hypothetical protein
MIGDTSHIKSLTDIATERQRLKTRLTFYEKEFKRKFQELPAELAAAGANNLIPKFLRGKVTDTALSGGKFLINKLFVSDDDTKPSIIGRAKSGGLFSVAKTVFKMFKGGK